MEELKRRRNIIASTLAAEFNLPKLAAYELCYLQLRFICELIGLGCLAAHGDIPTSKGAHEAYQPGRIFAELERLHPDFFPAPGEIIWGDNKRMIGMRPIENEALTKDGLKTLYETECGRILHKGSLKNLRPRDVDFDKVRIWDKKIVSLLNMHHIKLIEPKMQLWVRMISPERDDKVTAHLVDASWSGPGPEPTRGTHPR